MPPKKKEVTEEKPILGRFSSHLKVCKRLTPHIPIHANAPLAARFQSPQRLKIRHPRGCIYSICRFLSSLFHPDNCPSILSLGINSLQIGIVGLPNVGKSTTFNLLTKLAIPAENFPFCTIEPNHVRFLSWADSRDLHIPASVLKLAKPRHDQKCP